MFRRMFMWMIPILPVGSALLPVPPPEPLHDPTAEERDDYFEQGFEGEIGPAYHRYLTGQWHSEAKLPFFNAQRTDEYVRRTEPEMWAAHPARSR